MKKLIALLTVFVLCAAMVLPAYAADGFTPSVTNKPAPEIVPVTDPDGNPAVAIVKDETGEIISYVYEGCIVITPVAEATTSTLIPDDAEELLLDVYAKLLSGEMTLPYAEAFGLDASKMVIRDLFDVSFLCNADSVVDHPTMLAPKGVTIEVVFDLNVAADEEVYCMTYKNDAWGAVVSCKNNGDGTVTVVAEDFCPVSFSVETEDEPVKPPVQTGDDSGQQLMLWGGVALICLIAVVALTVIYSRGMKKTGK